MDVIIYSVITYLSEFGPLCVISYILNTQKFACLDDFNNWQCLKTALQNKIYM